MDDLLEELEKFQKQLEKARRKLAKEIGETLKQCGIKLSSDADLEDVLLLTRQIVEQSKNTIKPYRSNADTVDSADVVPPSIPPSITQCTSEMIGCTPIWIPDPVSMSMRPTWARPTLLGTGVEILVPDPSGHYVWKRVT